MEKEERLQVYKLAIVEMLEKEESKERYMRILRTLSHEAGWGPVTVIALLSDIAWEQFHKNPG